MTVAARWMLIVVTCAWPTCVDLHAQSTATTVAGTVTDEQGGVLPGVVARLSSSGFEAESVTDDRGTFRFVDVPPGAYELTALLSGFAFDTVTVVSAGQPIALTLRARLAPRSEHVTVTAQKHEQAIADVGMSVGSLTGEALASDGVSTMNDLANVVPGLTVSEGPFGIPVYSLRGVGNDDNQSPQAEPTVGVYVDDVPLPYSILTRGAFVDLDRAEILKGPQGTLFGLSTTGGAVNYLARIPTRDFAAGATIEGARFGRFGFDGYVNGPISDGLSARLALVSRRGGAWQRSASRGDELGDDGLTSARAQILWTPSRRLQVRFGYHWWQNSGDPLAGQVLAVTVQNPTSPATSALLQTPVVAGSTRAADWPATLPFGLDQTFHAPSAHVTVLLPRRIELTSVTGFGHFSRADVQPGGPGPIQDADFMASGSIRTFSQEVRLTRVGGPVTWIGGVHVANNRVRQRDQSFVERNSVTELVAGVLDFDTFFNEGDEHARTIGGFGHLEWSPSVRWRITAGTRYSNERKTYSGCTGDAGGLDGPATFFNRLFQTTVFVPGQCTSMGPDRLPGRFAGSLAESDISGRLGLDWKPRPGTLVYGNVSRGFKAGSFPFLAANTQAQLEPVRGEHVLAYEGGVKWQGLNGAVRASGSGFYYDYTDKQIRGSLVDPIFRVLARLVNIPRSRVAGADVGLAVRSTAGLSASLGAAWLGTKVLEFVGYDRLGQLQDFSGAAFPLAPAVQIRARVDVEHRIARRWLGFAGGDLSYSSATQGTADFVGLPEYRIDAYTIVNVQVGVSPASGPWRVTAWARNLTNTYYWLNAQRQSDFDIRWPGRPRMAGVSLSYRWR